MRCFKMQTMQSITSGGEPSALIQNEVLAFNDEERRALLQKAGISSTIAIGAAEVLAIKTGLIIPWINYDFLDSIHTIGKRLQQL